MGQLFFRDITIRYRQTYLGFFWVVFPQAVFVFVFIYIAKNRVLPFGETELPYVIHAVWGVSLWQFFSSGLLSATRSLSESGVLIKKLYLPRECLVISAVGVALVDYVVRLLFVFIVFFFLDCELDVEILFLPLPILAVLMLALGLGFFFSGLNLVFRDTANFISILLAFGVFAAPIFYPPGEASVVAFINSLNPFSYMLISSLEVMSVKSNINWIQLLLSLLFAGLIMLLGLKFNVISVSRVVEKA